LADSLQYICVHQSHGVAGSVRTLASWSARETFAETSTDYLCH